MSKLNENIDPSAMIGSLQLAKMSIAGKVALVTGGGRGIGKAVCEALLEKKAKVCIADINEEEGLETLKELISEYGEENVMFAKCDVSSDEDFETVIEATKKKYGHLDIIINNAGIGGEDDWNKLIDINLKGVIRGTLLGFRHLVDKNGVKGGTIINTSSVLGLRPSPYGPAYCASKFGVIGWTRAWGMKQNVDETNVKVNAICPKAVDTVLLADAEHTAVGADREKIKRFTEFLRSESMTPSTVADAYMKVLEDDVSGAVLVVDHKTAYYHVDTKEY